MRIPTWSGKYGSHSWASYFAKKKTNPYVPNKPIILKDEDRRAAKQQKKHNVSSVRKLEMVFNFLNAVSG